MDKTFSITRTQNRVFLDKAGKAVSGFTVSVYLTQYDEELEINVPSLDTKVVKDAVTKLIAERTALDNL